MKLREALIHGGRREEGVVVTRPQLYEAAVRVAFVGRARVFRMLVSSSGARQGDRVLDVGSGSGYLARIAAGEVGASGSVLGVDASAEMVAYSRRTVAAPSCRFEVGTAQSLPCADGEFDVVLSSFVIHHLPDEDQAAAIGEMRRVLRPGGRLLLADFRPPRSRLARHVVGALTGSRMLDNPDGRLAGLVRAAGFTVLDAGDLRVTHYVLATT